MSNVTGDGESFSSENNTCGEEVQQHQQQLPPPPPPPVKKKRNLPGTPDPAAEVIALSPATLMATNRFVCEVCNKGFQRDQNLQLHRRGHNLPWRLRQRAAAEARKRVYVCPEPGCVHHDPGRALGDLTGIKKHFCRKHGEKKWRCDRCSKKYAVRSDWKAHAKTCGTREYRCDCGTVFSRRDSFITHRAFCDALAEETNNGSGGGIKPLTPDAVATTTTTTGPTSISTSDFSYPRATDVRLGATQLAGSMLSPSAGHAATPPTPNFFDVPSNNGGGASAVGGAHMSATALLQKAAQLGATASGQQHQQMAGPDMRLTYSSAPSMPYGDGSLGGGSVYVNSSMIDGSLMMNHHHHHNHQRGSVFQQQQQQHGRFITKNNLEVAQESSNNMTTTVDFMGLSGVIRPMSLPRSSGANTTPAAIYEQGGGIMHKSIWD